MFIQNKNDIKEFKENFNLKIELFDKNFYFLGDYLKGGITISTKDGKELLGYSLDNYKVNSFNLSISLKANEKIVKTSENNNTIEKFLKKSFQKEEMIEKILHEETFKFSSKKLYYRSISVLLPFCIALKSCMTSSIFIQFQNFNYKLDWNLQATLKMILKSNKNKIKEIDINSEILSIFIQNNFNISTTKKICQEFSLGGNKKSNEVKKAKIKIELNSNAYKSYDKVYGNFYFENNLESEFNFKKENEQKTTTKIEVLLLMKVYEIKNKKEKIIIIDKIEEEIVLNVSFEFCLKLSNKIEKMYIYAKTFEGYLIKVNFVSIKKLKKLSQQENFIDSFVRFKKSL